uniref:Thioredoxin domain-containing protein n=1 Tax=Pseudictyota dubia TaxID=2749911 RepID=A0A7R9VUF0_9STRA|mmetsp:Transcript_22383/g.41714  ORF Transcript_22383/g.41714 Transcript_22383/m.41714 type:complete len:224 (+) Transcript_22383:339-1010(+)|eukprot:CAMPEP_0197438184 /NCGR_PEP_ID=MMETSP1175-20131217/5253_1 /TAXON_ID=1003142 /ORGANISM="Triceratium dubium, Strain CCMP147" /LENGTH=223 /DNA_ID=CAMNT_0042967863 /DNA_START=305 /DNA_END=976 /DNA_ORIENTATION=+
MRAIVALLFTVSTTFEAEGFTSVVSNRRISASPLNAVADPPVPAPAEHQKEEGDANTQSENESSDWTKTSGGFIPKILRRKERQERARRKPTIEHVETIQEYKTVVADENDRIVIVRFFAPWCKACRAAAPFFRKMAGDFSPDVKFVELPLTKDNAYLHEGLGVPSVPFAHIYHPDVGLVEEMKMNKKDFPAVQKVLEDYLAGSCEVPSFCFYDGDEAIGEFQ